jgi:transcriptional regulator with XRE-family HTH domain
VQRKRRGLLLVAEWTELGDLIQTWIDRQRLSKAAVARMAGVTRQTIHDIQTGASTRRDTLRRVVKAIATDPRSGDLDPVVYLEAMTEIFEVAGFEFDADDVVTLDLKDEVRRRTDRAAADVIVVSIDRYPSWTRAKRQAFINTLRALNAE